MQIHRHLHPLPNFRKAVVTIGSFDGLHLAHQKIIEQVKAEASRIGGESILVTFHPHPKAILHPKGRAIELLTTLEEKIALLKGQGIDHLLIVPFDRDFSNLSARDYIQHFLIDKLHIHTLIIGFDHRFGKDRSGDIHLLKAMAEQNNFLLHEIPEQVIKDRTISSSQIRQSLKKGELLIANELLGYPYRIIGKVVHGERRGRTLGFPTANIRPQNENKLIPVDGVYACLVTLPNGTVKMGALNIGHAPTFDGKERRIEVFILDFDGDLYGQTLTLELHRFIRPDQTFPNAETLVKKMREDVQEVRESFEKSQKDIE